ncbi:TraR/DksA family transcriptional regulator [Dyella sp. Tek66A03]|uniref:TraR/DksA family transcriptional regulator n=1 Tax=Dyella sp. Tek66A03 TaxID=3458298 RepID=UPI00403EA5AD
MSEREQAQKQGQLDEHFLEAQRARLLKLRDELVKVADVAGREEETVQFEAGGEARDDADGAEGMAIQENDEAIFRRNLQRLEKVQRALDRLEQGTYGLSEKSGKSIPRDRLLAIPEATVTLDEENRRG